MTELIVALDAPGTYPSVRDLAYALKDEAGISWIKIGPQSLAQCFLPMSKTVTARFKIFLDLKLADTQRTVVEATKLFAEAGITALSTFTDEATEAATRAAEGSSLRVWRVYELTDSTKDAQWVGFVGNGIIAPAASIQFSKKKKYLDYISPGCRLADNYNDGHNESSIYNPAFAKKVGVTHAVVGRPIYNAPDPVVTARAYLEALR